MKYERGEEIQNPNRKKKGKFLMIDQSCRRRSGSFLVEESGKEDGE